MRRATARLARIACAALALAALLPARAADLLVFAAASLRESLDENARAFEAMSGHRVRVSYAATSTLARQVEAGAPAHLFIAADTEWMRYVETHGALKGRPRPLLGNALALIAPAGPLPALRIAPGFDLAGALRNGRLALADPAAVPAGKYARAALESLGVWNAVRDRLAPADNVRTALSMVARAEAPLGIVYRTDAQADPAVAIVDLFPPGSHPPIVYPMAVVKGAPPAAEALARYLAAPEARLVWQRHGFALPPA